MDLAFTPNQEKFRADARSWIAQNLPAEWKGGIYRGPSDPALSVHIQKDWERRLYKAGYAAISWPREYGGQGLTAVEQLIVNEELGRAAAPEGLNTVGMELVGPILFGAGTEEQKKELIPKILNLDTIWCQGFSEPEAGSDLASVRTTAVRVGDHWVINGQKLWTTHARYSDQCIVLARTDHSLPKHKGLSLIMVPIESTGLTVRPLAQITGQEEFAEVFFEDVKVPVSNVIGAVNEGWRIAGSVLEFERGTLKLYRQGRFSHEFESMLRLAVSSKRNGAKNPYFRQRLADVYALLTIFRYHNLKLVSRIAAGERIGSDASISKLFWSEMHQKLSALSFDLLGLEGAAYGESTVFSGRFQELILNCRYETISAGTSQVQRNIIAERLLSLPRS